MTFHRNARTCPRSRRLLADRVLVRVGRWRPAAAAADLGGCRSLRSRSRPNSYQRPRPGELVHIDVKKLGKIGRPGHRVNSDRRTRTRGIGWEFVSRQ